MAVAAGGLPGQPPAASIAGPSRRRSGGWAVGQDDARGLRLAGLVLPADRDAVTGVVLPEKTRIALQVRMSFAAFVPRRHWLGGHLVLARRIDSPRFLRIDTYSPGNVVHTFRLASPADVDDEFVAWLAEAYQVGAQRHRRG